MLTCLCAARGVPGNEQGSKKTSISNGFRVCGQLAIGPAGDLENYQLPKSYNFKNNDLRVLVMVGRR